MEPLLSVCIISYNHERYLRECLQSVVTQITDFPFEVIIGDDCSTDGTVSIIDEFVSAHPGLITAFKHSRKVGGTENMLSVHNAAAGEFVAHLDGDDCMLPGKLQSQMDFMRRHPDHAFVAHDVEVVDPRSRVLRSSFGSGDVPESMGVGELVSRGCFFAHSSKVYRRSAARSRHRDRPTVDFFFHIEQALSGRVGFINRPLGRYRLTHTGLSSLRSVFQEGVLRGHLDAYDLAMISGVAPEIVYPALLNFRYVNAMHCIRGGQLDRFRQLAALGPEELRWANWRQRAVLGAPPPAVYAFARLFDSLNRRRRTP